MGVELPQNYIRKLRWLQEKTSAKNAREVVQHAVDAYLGPRTLEYEQYESQRRQRRTDGAESRQARPVGAGSRAPAQAQAAAQAGRAGRGKPPEPEVERLEMRPSERPVDGPGIRVTATTQSLEDFERDLPRRTAERAAAHRQAIAEENEARAALGHPPMGADLPLVDPRNSVAPPVPPDALAALLVSQHQIQTQLAGLVGALNRLTGAPESTQTPQQPSSPAPTAADAGAPAAPEPTSEPPAGASQADNPEQ